MNLIESALAACAVLCLLAALAPTPVRGRATVTTTSLFLVVGAAILAQQGLRWQLVGVLVAGLSGAALAGFRVRTARPRSRPGGVVFGAALTLAFVSLLTGAAAIWGFRPLDLPDPGGDHPVGTRTAYWTDASRGEPATTDPLDHRLVVAQIWYPTDSRGAPAPYLGPHPQTTQKGLANLLGVPAFLLGEAARGHGHSTQNAALTTGGGKLPIVLFSPGLIGVRFQNTAWAEYLAARGYLVVALDHPYDSAVTVDEQGRPLWSKVGGTGSDSSDNREADRLTAVRADDLSFALTQIEASPEFGSRIDTGRVAVAGHSAGGAAALLAAGRDDRFRAAIDIDGKPRDGARPDQPVLALVAGDGTGNEDNDTRYAAALDSALAGNPNSRQVTVADTKHLSLTDAPFLLPRVPVLFGSASREKAYAAVTGATQAFLLATFRNEPADLTSYGTVKSS
ncbi:alpha/beta hydrolase [Kineosporia succinea]|uniref:Dienelactone hydrolase n=1 Tax=Kineosporia succinea TaxID=84632 RepID=A0ABT9P5V4_9ACTN|nr:alpha/beta fold hydrolase [Kineosporia succinea]MDP9827941.1 dienelactone hydrolase [Kineosporia succinea]